MVRDGGVILFHDIEERDRGFGVWRLWEQLEREHSTFMFHHGHGLGVLAVGEARVDALRRLFSADEVTADRIRADFERLGAESEIRSRLAALPEELRHARLHTTQLEDKVAWLEHEAEDLRVAVRERDHRIKDLESSTSWRVTAPLRAAGRVLRRRE